MTAVSVGYLDKLASLRFFAALVVVFFHMSYMLQYMLAGGGGIGKAYYNGIFRNGFVGVSIFYVLSGFVISYANENWKGWKRYLIGRFARIYPAHWAASFLVVMALGLALFPVHANFRDSLSKLLANLALVHAWIPSPDYYFSINAVSWSLSVEVFFYVIFLFIRRLDDKYIYILAFGSYLTLILLELFVHQWTARYWRFYIYPVTRLPEFLIGMAIYRLYRNDLISKFRVLRVDFIFLLVLMLVTMALLRTHGVEVIFFYSLIPTPFSFLMVVSLLQEGSSSYMKNKILVLLGESSFALYLIHQAVIDYVTGIIGPQKIGAVFLVMLITLIWCICLSVAFHKLVETRLTRYTRESLSWLLTKQGNRGQVL
jgi:peptidoglycan/LPS O-acetylase OafA/YrhL